MRLKSLLMGTILVGGILFAESAVVGVFGSRGIRDLYNFNYQRGKTALVQKDDRILGFDKYWILLDGGIKMTEGKVVSDEGEIISVDKVGYRIFNQ